MTPVTYEELRNIKTFPSLIKYLRDELDWPIESEDFEDISFDWNAQEDFGIDKKHAAAIKEIKQLRPLCSNQPWGIFFINFEPKKLPVVVLRRLLNKLAVKKRSSAMPSDRQSWSMHDLLFISAYGEQEHRSISLAHFTESVENSTPTLKVVSWDDEDADLRLRHTDQTLHEYLRWPDDTADIDSWQNQWSSCFMLQVNEVIRTTKKMVTQLAGLASIIRKAVNILLEYESENGPLRKLMTEFKQTLIHELTEDDFANMYAQTVTYGLLYKAIRDHIHAGEVNVSAQQVTQLILPTNHFLGDIMEQFFSQGSGKKSGLDFDELGINDIVEYLNSDNVHMEDILIDFNNKNPNEDPVIHFYELFLGEYDSLTRKSRGVYYTPRPVVSFIVRSVHEILQKDFGLSDGLADTSTWADMKKKFPDLQFPTKEHFDPSLPFVQILDPATGTGTFLVETIDIIHKTMLEKWQSAGKKESEIKKLWNEYVPTHLLPRLHGFELMMAPYTIAHMKLGIKLFETGFTDFSTSQARINVFLTNTLEEPLPLSSRMRGAMADEGRAAFDAKTKGFYTVVIGNPPYSNYGQLNKNPFILALLDLYKHSLNDKKINLDDDFIKFFRYSTYLLDISGIGTLGLITNNVYLDGLTHRRMRQTFMQSFTHVNILNLHGSVRNREVAPDSSEDHNVFDIQQGVSITLVTKWCDTNSKIQYADLWGNRVYKYQELNRVKAREIQWRPLFPSAPYFFFVPKKFNYATEYESGWKVDNIFCCQQNCIKTDRDALFFDFDRAVLEGRIREFYSAHGLMSQFCKNYRIENSSSYDILNRRNNTLYSSANICSCLYRPFDKRWLYYFVGLTSRPAWEVMQHMKNGSNIGLLSKRQSKREPFSYILCTNAFVESCVFESAYANNSLFPLYLYQSEKADKLFNDGHDAGKDGRRANFSESFIKDFTSRVLLTWLPDGRGDLKINFGPEDIFHYMYAIFHSPAYRSRYSEFLKIDFPRLPLPGNREIFVELCVPGKKLVDMHLMENIPHGAAESYPFIGHSDCKMKKIGETGKKLAEVNGGVGRLYVNKAENCYFANIPEDVWEFQVGGYQVCHKWLDDRRKADILLTEENISQYQSIVAILQETISLMSKIDEIIDAHGGWPDAFSCEELAQN